MPAISLTETVEYGSPIVTSIQQNPKAVCQTCSARRELPDLIASLVRVMRSVGYGNADVLAVSLALEEAAIMAVAENLHECRTRARVWWAITAAAVTVVVEEELVDPAPVGQPRLRDRLGQSTAGGLSAIEACMSWVHLPPRGNCVAMGRGRTP